MEESSDSELQCLELETKEAENRMMNIKLLDGISIGS